MMMSSFYSPGPCYTFFEIKKMPFIPCAHGRQQFRCIDCNGAGICEHKRERRRCVYCRRSRPVDVDGRCLHGFRASNCRECPGRNICEEHRKYKYSCRFCKCDHGVYWKSCQICKHSPRAEAVAAWHSRWQLNGTEILVVDDVWNALEKGLEVEVMEP